MNDRERLHLELDRLIDQRDRVAEAIAKDGLAESARSDQVRAIAEKLAFGALALAADTVDGPARAIAFQHESPQSRAALVKFLSYVSEFAAPHFYASHDMGLDTFTWSELMDAILALHGLDYGEATGIFQRNGRKRDFQELLRKRRACLWTSYLQAKHGSKEAAVNDVAKAFEVSERSIYQWFQDCELGLPASAFKLEIQAALGAAEMRIPPHFATAEDPKSLVDQIKT